MKKISLLIVFLCMSISTCFSQKIMRSTISSVGASHSFTTNGEKYFVQQSVGQLSVIGNFQSSEIILRQGFIQPPLILTKVILEETTIEAIIYPNPFESSVNIKFSDIMNESLSIFIYDMLGRVVYQNDRDASQNVNINLDTLASAQYVLHIASGNKQFKATIIKK
ncbi:T9SS type A sorting domain-containing protein [Lutibacter flavus]|uniref:Por secretion system C-terminal sorting domain-containing protein n=1 Tax=Lutibacter flavus TaxID=691689 RepID=A0A238ZGZ7_9FLAO|nr:T9SS type A sorting domain-containing protein [Lutibacter flavus]SNR82288.1 Por secretion system C-terminal sorting domain-containing protein [Lutibacter flavus]